MRHREHRPETVAELQARVAAIGRIGVEVDVHVDQAGQQGLAGEVDAGRTLRHRVAAAADADDPAVTDQHLRIGDVAAAAHVEKTLGGEHGVGGQCRHGSGEKQQGGGNGTVQRHGRYSSGTAQGYAHRGRGSVPRVVIAGIGVDRGAVRPRGVAADPGRCLDPAAAVASAAQPGCARTRSAARPSRLARRGGLHADRGGGPALARRRGGESPACADAIRRSASCGGSMMRRHALPARGAGGRCTVARMPRAPRSVDAWDQRQRVLGRPWQERCWRTGFPVAVPRQVER